MIELIVGCMFSGKTSELLRRIRREEIAGRFVYFFKPSIDNRYSVEKVVSHDNMERDSIVVPDTKTLIENLDSNAEVIGIDEVQFFDDKIIDFCLEQSILGKKMICSGLNLDYMAKPFKFRNSEKHIGDLMVYSVPTLLTAVCTYKVKDKLCGNDAYFSQLLIKPEEYLEGKPLIGGMEKYAPRCYDHFEKIHF